MLQNYNLAFNPKSQSINLTTLPICIQIVTSSANFLHLRIFKTFRQQEISKFSLSKCKYNYNNIIHVTDLVTPCNNYITLRNFI